MAEKDTDLNKVADFFFGTPPNVKAKRARGEEVPLMTPVDILSKFGVSEEKIDKITKNVGSMPESVADAAIFLIQKGRDLGILDDPKESKAMGGSMLSRQNYEEGSKAIEVPQEVIQYDDATIKRDRALASENLTPAQIQKINNQYNQDIKNIDMSIIFEYARETGQLGGEELFPKEEKAMGGRINYQEGGSLMVPPEMEGMADDMPVDTYPNIPPEEMAEVEASQLPDEEMEDKYMDFVVNESLDSEEQSYLMNALETDPMLSQIFDKVITTASEFTGAGEVEGPGTGVSDSIPARLSDGEFVFTKKATDQMGADNLQMMMDDAERAFDGGEIRMPKQEGGMMMYKQKDEDPLAYEKIAQDEIKKNMLRANRAPSLLGVN